MTNRNLRLQLLLGLLLIFMVGCGAAENIEPTAVPAVAAGQETVAPSPVRADRDEVAEGNAPSPTPPDSIEAEVVTMNDETREPDDASGTGDSLGQEAVSPVVVDLSKITPVAVEGTGEAVEMPQPGVPDPGRAMTNKAILDLAQRLNIDVSEIATLALEEVQWRDASLGCPSRSMNYLMVITPGYRIVLEAKGEIYEYHTDRDQRVVLCLADNVRENPRGPGQ